jgi:hypothetical protein
MTVLKLAMPYATGPQRRPARRSKNRLIIPKRAFAAVASLHGTLRANKRRGDGGVKASNTGEQEITLGVTIIRNQNRMV